MARNPLEPPKLMCSACYREVPCVQVPSDPNDRSKRWFNICRECTRGANARWGQNGSIR